MERHSLDLLGLQVYTSGLHSHEHLYVFAGVFCQLVLSHIKHTNHSIHNCVSGLSRADRQCFCREDHHFIHTEVEHWNFSKLTFANWHSEKQHLFNPTKATTGWTAGTATAKGWCVHWGKYRSQSPAIASSLSSRGQAWKFSLLRRGCQVTCKLEHL